MNARLSEFIPVVLECKYVLIYPLRSGTVLVAALASGAPNLIVSPVSDKDEQMQLSQTTGTPGSPSTISDRCKALVSMLSAFQSVIGS